MQIVLLLVAFLARMIASRIGKWIAIALAFLGIQMFTTNVAVEPFLGQIQAYAPTSGIAVEWMAFLNIDKYISLIISAYATSTAARVAFKRSQSTTE